MTALLCWQTCDDPKEPMQMNATPVRRLARGPAAGPHPAADATGGGSDKAF